MQCIQACYCNVFRQKIDVEKKLEEKSKRTKLPRREESWTVENLGTIRTSPAFADNSVKRATSRSKGILCAGNITNTR